MTARIVLLHATPVAMAPIHAAFEEGWPEAEVVNLLDDGLTIDRAKEADVSASMIQRFCELGHYGFKTGADGILITCSAFGPAIDRLVTELPIPVVKPNEPMFRAALERGSKIGMLATFAPSVSTMTHEFHEFLSQTGRKATLKTVVVEHAIDALRKGDADTHNRLVAAQAHQLDDCDVVMLAHFSTSRAAEAVRQVLKQPVLSAPAAAVARIRELVDAPAERTA